MPSLMVPWVLRRNSSSLMPRALLNKRIGGMVASPTPIVPMSGDSMTRIAPKPRPTRRARIAAAIQPAVPPPTMAMSRTRLCTLLTDEPRMCRQGADRLLDHRAHAEQRRPGLGNVQNVRERIVVPWIEILAEENCQPAILVKMFLVEHGDTSA